MFESGIKYQETVTMVTEVCCSCGVGFGMPSNLNRALRDDPDKWFYCPNGHRQHYSESSTELALKKAKKELEAANSRIAQKEAINAQLEGMLKKQQTKLNRVHNGTCPCCKRHFKALAAHMKNKHPEYIKKING